MLTLFFTRLLAGGLTRAGLPTLRPLLLTEVLSLVAFLVVCGVWGPWRDPNAIRATIAGLLGVVAMAVQNALVQISLTNAPATSVMTTNVTRFVLDQDLERFMAKRMGAKTIQVKASHLSLISHPEEIVGLILEAAGQQAR
jgi:uncharacterized membrane protein YoaK (UPF0700 family)